ncbi:AlpA family transcriptional regulator [Photobacterium sp. TLY01]|uniref:helix-turn-helix transcriptional regulator n=1 Tax=Photobacterium sp. TLY01 TaxID=2907534 RepID=UPI001F3ACB38|nr:hypothetical protein [Photobacterium sp. TLY01]UIP28855.1 hypothetical protein LN341_05085 [Photobacterium sp. TLY01]
MNTADKIDVNISIADFKTALGIPPKCMFVTSVQVIAFFGISTMTLWRWRKKGFPAPKGNSNPGRYFIPDVVNYVNSMG